MEGDIVTELSEQAKESRNKILNAAEELFSAKGFDGTAVREISEKAGVNKALIFYYFKNKEDILQYLMNSLIDDMKQEALQLLQQKKSNLEDGHLVLEHDKIKFGSMDQNAVDRYMDFVIERSLDFYLKRKNVIRILVAESLKRGNHSSLVFRITDILMDNGKDSLMTAMEQDGIQLEINSQGLVERFFAGLMPVLSFVIYFDDWREHYHISEKQFKKEFIKSYKKSYGNFYR